MLDCPGGLKIQTIHSFAQSLLAAFPAEAGITPGFQPIEGRAEQELVRRTLADLMADAEADGDDSSDRRRPVPQPAPRRERCGRISSGLRAAPEALDALGPRDGDRAQIRELMGLPEESVEDYIASHCGDDRFDCDLLRAVADANRKWGSADGAWVTPTSSRTGSR